MSKHDSIPSDVQRDRQAPATEAGAGAGGKANTPQSDSEAARRSGQFGADGPGGAPPPKPRRGADAQPHPQGPEYEEGGRYPGTREPGTRYHNNAAAAYDSALSVWTRDYVPAKWASAQNNLGLALAALDRLDEAVTAYRRAARSQCGIFQAHRCAELFDDA